MLQRERRRLRVQSFRKSESHHRPDDSRAGKYFDIDAESCDVDGECDVSARRHNSVGNKDIDCAYSSSASTTAQADV